MPAEIPSMVWPVVLSLGVNAGDRFAAMKAMERAVTAILRPPLEWSRLMETEPVGVDEPQPWFLNRLVVGTSDMSARTLLEWCLDMERRLGRERPYRWAPRASDIDILLFGDLRIEEPGLLVPHPRIRDRRFCLDGLSELLPCCVVPGVGATVAQLREEMTAGVRGQQVRFIADA